MVGSVGLEGDLEVLYAAGLISLCLIAFLRWIERRPAHGRIPPVDG